MPLAGLVVCIESDDVLAAGLAGAARRQGVDVDLIDLRVERPSVAIESGRARVRTGGRYLSPQIVLNRTTTSSLGMPSSAAVAREMAARSGDERYVAAREEQGLMLSAFAIWASAGATIINAVSAFDQFLQPELARRRLTSAGLPIAHGRGEVQVLVAGDSVIHGVRSGRAIELTEQASATAIRAAQRLGMTLARIDLADHDDPGELGARPLDLLAGDETRPTVTRPVVAGWHPMPLRAGRVSDPVIDAVAGALGFDRLIAASRSDEGGGLFVADIVANLRGAARPSTRRDPDETEKPG